MSSARPFKLRAPWPALLMMRCRPGTAQSSTAGQVRASGDPGSAAHRFAHARAEIVETVVHALALRRIRDTPPGYVSAHWTYPRDPRLCGQAVSAPDSYR